MNFNFNNPQDFLNNFSKFSQKKYLPYLIPIFFLFSAKNCFYSVDTGHKAIKFNRITGLSKEPLKEGWHFRLPYFQFPIIYNVQNKNRDIIAETANRDMQNVKISVSVLYHPVEDSLYDVHLNLGKNYDDKVIPPLVNQIMRSVVAQYTASQLMSQRDQVSDRIKASLEERAKNFNINITNVAIKELNFGTEYRSAVEQKQVAQQEAQRAKYLVEQAREMKKSIIIKAEAEAKSIELVGSAAMKNPSYLSIRKIEYSKQIAKILADTQNSVLLNSNLVMRDLDAAMVS